MESNNSYNKFVDLFFKDNTLTTYTIDSFNSLYDDMLNMLENLNLRFTNIINNNKESLNIQFIIQNIRFISPYNYKEYDSSLSDDMPKTPSEALNTNSTYSAKIIGDMKIILKKMPTYEVGSPFMTNLDAILNGTTEYNKSIFDPITVTETVIKDAINFSIPIMLKSKHCILPYLNARQKWNLGEDPISDGGIFIIKGVEYAYQNVSSHVYNAPIVISKNYKKQKARAEYISQRNIMYGESYSTIFLIYQNNIKYNSLKIINYDLCCTILASNNDAFKNDKEAYVPIGLIFKIFGTINDKDILDYVDKENNNPILRAFIIECLKNGEIHKKYGYSGEMTRHEAMIKLGKIILSKKEIDKIEDINDKFANKPKEVIKKLIEFRMIESVERNLSEYFMINLVNTPKFLCFEIGEIIKKMWEAKEDPEHKQTDRDNLEVKRIQIIGKLMLDTLRSTVSNMFYGIQSVRSDIKNTVYNTLREANIDNYFNASSKNIQSLSNALKGYSNNVTITFNNVFLSRESIQGKRQQRIVPMNIEHATKVRYYANLRNIIIRATSKDSQVSFDQRRVHPSHFGFLCPVQTPEGAGVGKYQQPTYPSYITIPKNENIYKEYIKNQEEFIEDIDVTEANKYYFVKLNNTIIGYCLKSNGRKLYEKLMEWRSTNDHFLSVVLEIEENRLNVYSDCGRLMIPLINLEYYNKYLSDGTLDKKMESWDTCIKNRLIEYFDSKMTGYNSLIAESADSLINPKFKYTHLFMPEGTLGISAASIPFINMMKSARAIIATAQIIHNISVPCYNYASAMYKDIKILHHPQIQVVGSVINNKCFGGAYPMYENVLVQFKNATYNQDDGIIMNEGAIYRNLYSISIFKVFKDIKSQQNEQYGIGTVNKIAGMSGKDFSIIDKTYAVPTAIGYNVKYNTVLIAKLATRPDLIDKSIVYNKAVMNFQNDDSDLTGAKYIIISNSSPEVYKNSSEKMVRTMLSKYSISGDKYAATNAQKSILNTIIPSHKMDITANGVSPTIIMGTTIFSRGTYGMFIEPKFAEYVNKNHGAIVINQFANKDKLYDAVENIDMYKKCYNGVNGCEIPTKFLMGIVSYAAQEQLVENKLHARDKGQKNAITRDPLRGKSHNGGSSIGSMEIDSLLAAGISRTMNTQFGKNSSDSLWFICKNCNTMNAYYNATTNIFACTKCGPLDKEMVSINGFCYKPVIFDAILRGSGYSVEYN